MTQPLTDDVLIQIDLRRAHALRAVRMEPRENGSFIVYDSFNMPIASTNRQEEAGFLLAAPKDIAALLDEVARLKSALKTADERKLTDKMVRDHNQLVDDWNASLMFINRLTRPERPVKDEDEEP